MDLTDGALKSAQNIFTELETVKVGGSIIIGLQKWVGPVPPTYNGSNAHAFSTNDLICIIHLS